MRVAAYLRVSTDRQAEVGLGLDVQEQTIRGWARANEHRIVGWYRDEGLSGSNGLDTRVGLVDALEMLKDRRAHGLVVYRLDRLARDLVLQEQLLADVWRNGAHVFSCSPAESSYLSDDPDDPSRALIRQMLGAVAQYERSLISLRLRSGRRRKHEKGGYAYGAPPYGFRAVNGQLEPLEDEQRLLRRVQELRDVGLSFNAIAAALTSEGYQPRRGTRWHPQVVSRLASRAV